MGNDFINFEENTKYNYENQISMAIILQKTCYFKGEVIEGLIFLLAKKKLKDPNLKSPSATITIREFHHDGLTTDFDFSDKKDLLNKAQDGEETVILKYPITFSKIEGINLSEGMKIPFQCQIPEKCNPSCIFDSNAYAIHFLDIDFESINAKKSTVIVIKNNIFFTKMNNLYKSPAICKIERTKHEYAIFNKGSFTASIKLPKNCFTYDEIVPFLIEINCSKLNIDIKSVNVSLNIKLEVKNKLDPNEIKSLKIKEIVSKSIPLTRGEKIYSIDDIIKIPSTIDNPNIVYKRLDSDHRLFSEKFENIFLYPSCYEGILNCLYSIRVMIEIDSLFSTNEFLEITLDFYEPQNNITHTTSNINQDKFIQTPLGNNNSIKNENKITEDIEAPPSFEQSLNQNANSQINK